MQKEWYTYSALYKYIHPNLPALDLRAWHLLYDLDLVRPYGVAQLPAPAATQGENSVSLSDLRSNRELISLYSGSETWAGKMLRLGLRADGRRSCLQVVAVEWSAGSTLSH